MLDRNQESESWDLRSQIHFGAVFGRMSRLLGLRFTDQFEEQLWRWIDNGCIGEMASVDIINQALISISPTVRSLPFNASFLVAVAMCTHQRPRFLFSVPARWLNFHWSPSPGPRSSRNWPTALTPPPSTSRSSSS